MFSKMRRRLLPVLLIVLVFVLPMVLANIAYKYYQQHPKNIKTMNRGELVNPTFNVKRLMLVKQLNDDDTINFQGMWSLLYIMENHCGDHCQKNLYYLRQIHTAAGKNQGKVQRVIATINSVDHDIDLKTALQRYRGTKHLIFSNYTRDALAEKFTMPVRKFNESKPIKPIEVNQTERLFIVDPQGRIILRYEGNFIAKDVLHDLKRLLRAAS